MNPSHFEMPFFSKARKRTIISLCTEIPRYGCCGNRHGMTLGVVTLHTSDFIWGMFSRVLVMLQ